MEGGVAGGKKERKKGYCMIHLTPPPHYLQDEVDATASNKLDDGNWGLRAGILCGKQTLISWSLF